MYNLFDYFEGDISVMEKEISTAVIRRLPRYYRYLGSLMDNGITRISSRDLSRRMGLTASQIRQDLNNFGAFGQQGYGYNVEKLYYEIRKILGLDKTYNMIIIGAGNIGQALLNYINYQRRGYNFVGVFDKNPKLIGLNIRGTVIRDIDTLEDFLDNTKVDIAVLTLPGNDAEEVIKIIIDKGVRGIWNFSHMTIKTPPGVVMENVHLTDSLMTLSYKLKEESKE